MIRMTNEGRRYRRVPCQISALVLTKQGEIPAQVADVSLSGVMLHAARQWPMRTLIRVKFFLGAGEELELFAMVVRHINRPAANAPFPNAMGLYFYANGDSDMQRWGAFVRKTADQIRGSEADDVPTADDSPSVSLGSCAMRRLVYVDRVEDLYDFLHHEVHSGKAFWPTNQQIARDTEFELLIVHPVDESRFVLRVVAEEYGKEKGCTGLWVRITNQDPGPFKGFIEAGLPWLDIADAIEGALDEMFF
ncbi:MAG: PilZ domain-containing protein [Myxococcota bacterium]